MRMSRLAAGLVSVGLVGVVPIAISAPAQAAEVATTTTLTVAAPSAGRTAFSIGDTLSFSGAVTGATPGTAPTSGTATLQVQTAATPVWTAVATDTTPSSLSFPGVTAQTNAQYKVVFSNGTSGFGSTANTYTASESAPVAVPVSRTLKISSRGLTIRGKVTPDYEKKRVKILRKDGKKFKKYTTVKTDKKGKFTFRAPGRVGFRFVVLIPASATYAASAEAYRVRAGF